MVDAGSVRDALATLRPSLTTAVEAVGDAHRSSARVELFGRPLRAWQEETRSALGLSANGPIVMTGHQAGIWHAGILAKWIAADVIADRTGATVAALVVDQDVNDAAAIEYPTVVDGSLQRGRLPVEARSDAGRNEGGPTGTRRPIRLGSPTQPPVPEVAPQLEAIRAAVNAHVGAANLALQMSAANQSLLDGIVRPVTQVCASSLLATPLGARLVEAMRSDPEACRRAYNEALALDPQVARPLGAGELPMWTLGPGRRDPVRAEAIPAALAGLAPRAFFMTAFARLACCDVFLHGTGGERYERVTEAWIARWLGVPLAPMAMATATLRLPLAAHLHARRIITRADLRRVAFDPERREGMMSPAKRELLAAIDAAPRGSADRRERFRALMRYIESARHREADALGRLRGEVAASRDAAIAAEVATSRTWPWPLHDRASLAALRAAIASTTAPLEPVGVRTR